MAEEVLALLDLEARSASSISAAPALRLHSVSDLEAGPTEL
jgi:hypothetical protein